MTGTVVAQDMLRYWKFVNLFDSSPWERHNTFLRGKLDQLRQTCEAVEDIAAEDPVGMLALFGILCLPINQEVDKEVDDIHLLTHQAQQYFSMAILEEPDALDEPIVAASAYIRWARAAIMDGTRGSFDFEELYARPPTSPSSPGSSNDSDSDSACSAATDVCHSGPCYEV